MVKMSLPSSKNQASSCSTEFNNLKQDLSTIRDAVNKVQELDIDGKAAQQAKAYASKVAGPFISKVNDLLDTMENDIKKLPNKYESMVDNKSWSSDELEEKINSCNKEIMIADLTIAGVSAFMATPGQNDNDMKKCLNSAEKSKENAKSKKAKYEKILEHLKQFDVDSVTIFNNVKDINVAVKQGAGVISKASDYKMPSAKELKWEKTKCPKDSFKKVKVDDDNPIEKFGDFIGSIGGGMEDSEKYRKHGKGFEKTAKVLKRCSKEGALDDVLNTVAKVSPKVEKIFKGVPEAGFIFALEDATVDFYKRKELGESNTEALERTVLSQSVQVFGGDIAGMITGLQGAAYGALGGFAVTAAGGGEGAVPGAVIGGVTAYTAGSIYFQEKAEEKLDSDIESN